MPILVIDTGNSRTKWGVHDGTWLAQGVIDNASIADLAAAVKRWAGCTRAVISNVAGEALQTQLDSVLNSAGIQPVVIHAQASACGVVNGYADVTQLGSDRWAALLAARDMTHAPCVVATAGTALTVDALSGDGKFLGGLIVPGLTEMQQAIASSTAIGRVQGALEDFPVNTAAAVHSGALQAMAGAVDAMCEKLGLREGREPVCILTGGDAETLLPVLHRPVQMTDNLVLQGLVLIAGEWL